jgi:hypothetical protein
VHGVLYIEFCQQVLTVRFDGVKAYRELMCNFFGGETIGHQAKDL